MIPDNYGAVKDKCLGGCVYQIRYSEVTEIAHW